MPPEQAMMGEGNNRRNIPAEIVEKILLNLPATSLSRFSSVSKSWRSMISQSGFMKRYRTRAALPGQERISIGSSPGHIIHASSSPHSSISSERGNPFYLPDLRSDNWRTIQ